jgi:hypothetical protein
MRTVWNKWVKGFLHSELQRSWGGCGVSFSDLELRVEGGTSRAQEKQ